MQQNPESVEGNESRDLRERVSALSGKVIEVDGAQIGMPDLETVQVEVSGVYMSNPKGVDAEGTEFALGLIPTAWKAAEPERKFGAEALSLAIEDPEEFLREHAG